MALNDNIQEDSTAYHIQPRPDITKFKGPSKIVHYNDALLQRYLSFIDAPFFYKKIMYIIQRNMKYKEDYIFGKNILNNTQIINNNYDVLRLLYSLTVSYIF